MDISPEPFVPPHPIPRTTPPSALDVMRILMRNPIELWGEMTYREPYVSAKFLGKKMLIVNDPSLIKHILVTNVKNYPMGNVRQLILKPILRDGLLVAEDETWRHSRKAMAPVFTPRHIHGFAEMMRDRVDTFAERYRTGDQTRDIALDMTDLTYQLLAVTLFSDEVVSDGIDMGADVEALLSTMGMVDPLDVMEAPSFLPRIRRMRGKKFLQKFRNLVRSTMEMRRQKMRDNPDDVKNDFLTLLLAAGGPGGLSDDLIEDNLITFIGAGHETTARALGWTFYLLSKAPHERALVEEEIEAVLVDDPAPSEWLSLMPKTRAVFEEAMRLYPPAAVLGRQSIEEEVFTFPNGETITIEKNIAIQIMPWTLHRNRLAWENPNAFIPSRFWPENRDKIDRFQYLPFGAGPRICIGANFALQEAVIALALLLKEFRFDATPDLHPMPIQKLTVHAENGLPMQVSARR